MEYYICYIWRLCVGDGADEDEFSDGQPIRKYILVGPPSPPPFPGANKKQELFVNRLCSIRMYFLMG